MSVVQVGSYGAGEEAANCARQDGCRVEEGEALAELGGRVPAAQQVENAQEDAAEDEAEGEQGAAALGGGHGGAQSAPDEHDGRQEDGGPARYNTLLPRLHKNLRLTFVGPPCTHTTCLRKNPDPNASFTSRSQSAKNQQMDSKTATRILSQDAYSVTLDGLGIKQAYGAQLPSNSPCEDRYNRAQSVPLWQDEKWVGVTIFDGHNGCQTAEHLEKELLKAVQAKLNTLEPESRNDEAIQHAIQATFTEVDKAIITDYTQLA
ncbi:phosphatase 2C [Cordyceps militaris]|uniref:Phosphatase 2C n=1 Tax=Cordyceps militaris TaxID=73501 RepID=A0A2H4SME3_CORMI|nr:phosphatase 2C [Cordyceps militaris]